MKLSVLQLNINADNFWDRLVPFLKEQDFDVLQLQEVTGPETVCGNFHSKRDVFMELEKLLGSRYSGELSITQRFTSSYTSYFGNVTLFNNSFQLLDKHEFTLHHETEYYPSDAKSFEGVGRRVLHLHLAKDGKEISLINTHFAWGPTPIEKSYQTEQGDKLAHYVSTVTKPFILTGDLNLQADQPTIQKLSKLATNLTEKHSISNTLNPHLHEA